MTTDAPLWVHCGQGAGPGDPFAGCTGITVTASGRCLADADATEQTAYLASLSPGADLDLRGTTIGRQLLSRILSVMVDPATRRATLGTARFDSAIFTGDARFDSVAFAGDAWFTSVTFAGVARFTWATFAGVAWFDSATFTGVAWFDSATFTRNASFTSAVFESTRDVGPLVCAGVLDLSTASFAMPVALQVAAWRVVCRRTRWAQAATVWVRYAEVDLSDAVVDHPLAVATRQRPFDGLRGPLDESAMGSARAQAKVVSLRGVDAAHLVLTDLDLSACLFCGTIHLDLLRLEGRCPFGLPNPAGIHWRRGLPVRHTQRLLLAEEQHWRHSRHHPVPGWLPAPPGVDIVEPPALAALYRALRKSYEDSRNEPGAADFYYGEMEMRRADPTIAPAERGLLNIYWALSGYGLRAARAVGWLLAAVALTMLLMMLWGLPAHDTATRSTGTVTGRRIILTTDASAPENPTGPPGDRLTTGRFEKSLRVVVNSVIFRSSGQDLTTTGTYTEMASRLTEPVLLGLAALAVRGRIKR
ncbi:pentapeptide repeat-containing protein [Streptomyces sp. NBC_00433]